MSSLILLFMPLAIFAADPYQVQQATLDYYKQDAQNQQQQLSQLETVNSNLAITIDSNNVNTQVINDQLRRNPYDPTLQPQFFQIRYEENLGFNASTRTKIFKFVREFYEEGKFFNTYFYGEKGFQEILYDPSSELANCTVTLELVADVDIIIFPYSISDYFIEERLRHLKHNSVPVSPYNLHGTLFPRLISVLYFYTGLMYTYHEFYGSSTDYFVQFIPSKILRKPVEMNSQQRLRTMLEVSLTALQDSTNWDFGSWRGQQCVSNVGNSRSFWLYIHPNCYTSEFIPGVTEPGTYTNIDISKWDLEFNGQRNPPDTFVRKAPGGDEMLCRLYSSPTNCQYYICHCIVFHTFVGMDSEGNVYDVTFVEDHPIPKFSEKSTDVYNYQLLPQFHVSAGNFNRFWGGLDKLLLLNYFVHRNVSTIYPTPVVDGFFRYFVVSNYSPGASRNANTMICTDANCNGCAHGSGFPTVDSTCASQLVYCSATQNVLSCKSPPYLGVIARDAIMFSSPERSSDVPTLPSVQYAGTAFYHGAYNILDLMCFNNTVQTYVVPRVPSLTFEEDLLVLESTRTTVQMYVLSTLYTRFDAIYQKLRRIKWLVGDVESLFSTVESTAKLFTTDEKNGKCLNSACSATSSKTTDACKQHTCTTPYNNNGLASRDKYGRTNGRQTASQASKAGNNIEMHEIVIAETSV